MSEDHKPTAQERIAAAQARRNAQRETELVARVEQEATDKEAIADLEAEHGHERVRAIELQTWTPSSGSPVWVAVVVPTGASKLAQRFIEQINRSKEGSKERLTAQDALATECWAYPPKSSEAFKAVLEIAPLILSHAALQIVKASQGQAEQEGKG